MNATAMTCPSQKSWHRTDFFALPRGVGKGQSPDPQASGGPQDGETCENSLSLRRGAGLSEKRKMFVPSPGKAEQKHVVAGEPADRLREGKCSVPCP